MKVLKIIVDELPDSCGDCDLLWGEYCSVITSQWVNRCSCERDKDCPLQKEGS
jgi:hypothetical protein